MPKSKKTHPEVQEPQAEVRDAESRIMHQVTPEMLPDRMLRNPNNLTCPECDAFPTVCKAMFGDWSAHYCRECGYQWEEGTR